MSELDEQLDRWRERREALHITDAMVDTAARYMHRLFDGSRYDKEIAQQLLEAVRADDPLLERLERAEAVCEAVGDLPMNNSMVTDDQLETVFGAFHAWAIAR